MEINIITEVKPIRLASPTKSVRLLIAFITHSFFIPISNFDGFYFYLNVGINSIFNEIK